MEITIDNKKMWESILKELWHYPLNSWLVECIKAALRDQGLQYNSDTKKIESIKPGFKIEKGKWYMCVRKFDMDGHFTCGKSYYSPCHWILTDDNGSDVYFYVGVPFSVYFRPATPEEIPHSESEQEELNEFEKWFKKLIGCYASAMGTPLIEQPEDRQNDFVKKHAQSLLSITRKQIASEIDIDRMVEDWCLDFTPKPSYAQKESYRQGIEDTLKAIKEG